MIAGLKVRELPVLAPQFFYLNPRLNSCSCLSYRRNRSSVLSTNRRLPR